LTEEGVVDAEEVDDLKREQPLAKVVQLAEGDTELDAFEGDNFLP
jgi:hypothetical protein